jgi:hypothetical protein
MDSAFPNATHIHCEVYEGEVHTEQSFPSLVARGIPVPSKITTDTDILLYVNIQGLDYFFLPVAEQPPVGQGLLTVEASRSHSDTPHSVGILWTSDKPDAETST